MENVLETIKLGENNTIKSTDLVDIINEFRKVEGKKKLQHGDFMKKIRKELKALKSLGIIGQGKFSESEYINKQGHKQPCFELNKDGMLQMLNSESTLVRYKTIEFINKLIEENKQLKEQLSERDKLLLQLFSKDPNIVASAHEKLVELETKPLKDKIEEDKPMVDFAETITESSDTIDMGTMAKLVKDEGIKMGRNKLFEWLRDNKYLMVNNKPYQKYIDNGVFQIREFVVHTSFGDMNKTQTLVTGKGQVYIINKLKDEIRGG